MVFLTHFLLLVAVSFSSFAQGYTKNEETYLPLLKSEISRSWPEVTKRSHFAAQVRQETCAGMKSPRCWSPMAELKTSREYGFGLGQLTVTSKFDNFREAKKLDPSLREWAWENRYNAQYQLRTMILMDKSAFRNMAFSASPLDRMAFSFAAYNGGVGGVLSDRSVCRSTSGCDPSRWFGHVELTSKKAKVNANGYGKSFFEINREYVRHIISSYHVRYLPYFNEE